MVSRASASEDPSYEWRCANQGLARVWNGQVWYSARENETPAAIARHLKIDAKLLVAANKSRLRELTATRRLHPYTPLLVPKTHEETFETTSLAVATTLAAPRSRFGRVREWTMRFDPAQAAAMPQWKKTKLIDSPTIRRGGASPAKKSSSSSSSSTSSASSGAAAAVVVERPLSPPVQRSVVTRPPPARLSAAALKRKGLVDRLPSVGDELEEVEFEADKGNEVEQLEVVAESELREYHMKYGLDFGKMAPKGDRKMVGLLQRQYYSRPIACREEELSYQDEVAAEWSLVDDALVKVENQCRYYSEIKVAYRGRQWDISPDSDLIPMIHAPDVPETTFPVKVVDIYVDPNGFAMLSFKWFYRKHEIKRASGKRAKKSIAFYEEEKDEEVAEGGRRRRGVEVAVGTAVFSTPIEFVRDASLVAYGNTLLHSPLAKNADFYCRREYDDQTHVLRPLLV